MVSRFWRAGGNALRPDCMFLADVATSATIWNGSGDTPPSSTDWFRTNSNLTAERTSTSSGFWALCFGSQARTSGVFRVRVDAIGTGGLGIYIGHHASGGGIVAGTSNEVPSAATYTTNDVIEVDYSDGANIVFRKQTGGSGSFVTQGTINRATYGIPASLRPAVSSGNSSNSKVTFIPVAGW